MTTGFETFLPSHLRPYMSETKYVRKWRKKFLDETGQYRMVTVHD
jgi:hypothetical protein